MAKTQKLSNGGVVALDVKCRSIPGPSGTQKVVMIAPDSIEVVHGKFKKG